MTLYLHPDADGALAKAYQDAFQDAEEIFVLSAYLRDWKAFALAQNCENATLIVGKDFGITRKKALTQALAWQRAGKGISHVYVADGIDGFHPKLVAWRKGKDHFLIIGSSNLTVAAFETNYEANIRIKISRERYDEIADWISDILRISIPLSEEWIEGYVEASVPPGATKATKKGAGNTSGPVLPRFPGLAKALAERKEKAAAFTTVRPEFEQLIRASANSKVTNRVFYDWLLENWNNSDWKFQGSGIFRRDPNATDWCRLCKALVAILDSPANARDAEVQARYDELESSGRAEARRAFLTEMLCHFFPDEFPLWNGPIEIWLRKEGALKGRPRGLSAGGKYLWLTTQLRAVLKQRPDYPARNLAELDHVIWAYCRYRGWIKR